MAIDMSIQQSLSSCLHTYNKPKITYFLQLAIEHEPYEWLGFYDNTLFLLPYLDYWSEQYHSKFSDNGANFTYKVLSIVQIW